MDSAKVWVVLHGRMLKVVYVSFSPKQFRVSFTLIFSEAMYSN